MHAAEELEPNTSLKVSVGHCLHIYSSVVFLKVPFSQAMHVLPGDPEYPVLQRQLCCVVLLEAEAALWSHGKQSWADLLFSLAL